LKLVRRLIIITVAGLALLYGCAMQPRYDGPAGEHFDGVRFYNAISADKSIFDIAAFVSTFWLRRESWPEWIEDPGYAAAPVPNADWVVTYINHSTVLLRSADVNILTDPIWAERASPFSFAGPRRVRKPGLELAQLPPLDAILISHDHYDHLDIETLRALAAFGRDGPPLVLIGLGNAALLERHGIENYRELDWWQTVKLRNTEFTFVEVRHRSGRGVADQMKTLWGGFVIRSSAGQAYFAGDTGYGPHFSEARRRYGDFDLSLIPIAAYRPRAFMRPVHLDPADAVRAHLDLGSRQSVAIHHGTFQLTYESLDEPYQELQSAMQQAALEQSTFKVLGFGESLRVSAQSKVDGHGAQSRHMPSARAATEISSGPRLLRGRIN
jgi:L-ascorbate metabolism protein UlaG (beta-lactamase superfamily)